MDGEAALLPVVMPMADTCLVVGVPGVAHGVDEGTAAVLVLLQTSGQVWLRAELRDPDAPGLHDDEDSDGAEN